MNRDTIHSALFFLIAAIFIYLFYVLIIPFFAPICWAAVFTILFFPLYEKLLTKVKSRGVSSILMCLIIVTLIIGPISYLLLALVGEAVTAVTKVNDMLKTGEINEYVNISFPWLDSLKEKLSAYYDFSTLDTESLIKRSIESVSTAIINQAGQLVTNATRMIFYFVLMVFTMYYFFKDGERIIAKLKRLMPLKVTQIDLTFKQLTDVIQATMYGSVTVALIQGLLGGILFAAVGIPSAVFWGAIMAFLSIIPFLGAFIIFIPAGMILILGGFYIKGLLVIILGTAVISQIDNVLRPYLIAGKTEMHPLLLFFSIMGGILLFGVLGAILGPLIAAIFVTLLNIFEFRLHPKQDIPQAD